MSVMKKNKTGYDYSSCGWEQNQQNRVVRQDLTEKVTYLERTEGGKGVNYETLLEVFQTKKIQLSLDSQ